MHRFTRGISLIAALVAGMFIAVQSRLNGGLGVALGDGVFAALLSFGSGWIVIGVALSLSKEARAGLGKLLREVRSGSLPIWMTLGGLIGGALVITQGLAAGVLGVSLFTVAVVAGQSISAILIDSKGWLGVAARPISAQRLAGALAVTGGVGLVADGFQLEKIALVALPFLAGLGLGFQQAANGRVKVSTQSAIAATFVNFAMGSILILFVKIATLPLGGFPTSFPTQWWLYLGGIVGVSFIAIQIITVSKIGVLALGILLGTGQLIGSFAIDLLFPVADQDFSLLRLLGIGMAMLGAVLVNLRK